MSHNFHTSPNIIFFGFPLAPNHLNIQNTFLAWELAAQEQTVQWVRQPWFSLNSPSSQQGM